jgi:hypothetical protein
LNFTTAIFVTQDCAKVSFDRLSRRGHLMRVGLGIVFMAAALLAAGTAYAQSIGAPPAIPNSGQHLGKTVPQRDVHPDEHLAMPMFPNDWARNVAQSGTIEVFEYMPRGQAATTWTEKITLEIHHGSTTLPLDAYQRRALGQVRENCDGIFEGKLQTGVNNGFPAAYWMLGCKRDRRGNWGELRYTKAIQGGDTLYLLSRAWRTPMYGDQGPPVSSSAVEEARNFLGSAVVCVPSTAQHPCPAGDKSPLGNP